MGDCEFYEKLLNEYQNVKSIKVSRVDVKDACEKGANFVSKVDRVCIYGTKDSSGFQTSLIQKLFSENATTKTFKFDELFQNEIIFFKEMLQHLQKYSKHMLGTPKCLYIGDFLVYEDLNESGFHLKPKGHRFTVEEVKLVLKEISKFHAASLSLQQNEPKFIETIDKKMHHFVNREENEGLEKVYVDHFNIAIKTFEDMNNVEVASILASFKSNICLKLAELFEGSTEIKVFNHGDLWGNNIFFKDDQIKLIDFQLLYYGSPGIDLTYFLWINVDPDTRRGNFKEFLSYYIENLRTFAIENNLNQGTIEKLTMAWIQGEMNRFSLNGLVYCFVFLPVFFMKVDDYMAEGEEYENLKEIWLQKMNESYKDTLIKSVLEFVDTQKSLKL